MRRRNSLRKLRPRRQNQIPRAPDQKKGAVTREKILQAALRVFSEHPYKSASLRQIGQAGGFDHPLIHYYFPNKARLFEAVVEKICEEFYRANLSWFEGLERLSPAEGFSLYIDRLLEYNFRRPEPMRVIMLNAALLDRLEEIPGYQHIPKLLARLHRTFEEKVALRASSEEIDMFLHSFNGLIVYLLGAPCQAQVLGLNHFDPTYREWVKKTLLFLFLPRLEKLIFPQKE